MITYPHQIFSEGDIKLAEKTDLEAKKDRTTVSRRDFLKYSGTIVLVLGSGCYASINGKLKDTKTPVIGSTGIPASDGYLLVDVRNACMPGK